MDTYADDLVALTEALDLKNAIHVGHSTGGGEVSRYIGRHGTGRAKGRVGKAVLIGAVPPLMVKTPANPGGLPLEVFDGFRKAELADRAQLYKDIPAGPFYGFNRSGAKVSQGLIDMWWRQGMMAGAKATYDCIKAFSETDFTEDLKRFDVPTLIAHVTSVMTLLPGDVILTGTPDGVGPMEVGDEVDVVISGIGTLTNKVVSRD